MSFFSSKNATHVHVILPPRESIRAYLVEPPFFNGLLDPDVSCTIQDSLSMALPQVPLNFIPNRPMDLNFRYQLRCDIVQYQLEYRNVYLLGKPSISIEHGEALFKRAKGLIPEDCMLTALTPTTWVLGSTQPFQISTTPLFDVVGQCIHSHLPTGQKQQDWRRLQLEIEMAFYDPISLEKPFGIWLWGETDVQGSQLPHITSIYTDTSWFLNAKSLEDWRLPELKPGAYYLVFDGLDTWMQTGCHTLGRTFHGFCQRYLYPLIEAWQRKQISTVTVTCLGAAPKMLRRRSIFRRLYAGKNAVTYT